MPTYDLGFLGGGQLARMSIQAAQRMGLRCLSLDPGKGGPAAQVADAIVGRLDDPSAIARVFETSAFVTLENEFIPADAIRQALAASGREASCVVPSVDALAVVQDKLLQRQAFDRAGVASPRAVPAERAEEIGFPCVLKARFGGYDGKGTRYARTREEYEAHRPLWELGGWLAEEFVPFRRELAVMVCIYGEHRFAFPTVETVQTNHVCDLVFPADVDATEIALRAVESVGGTGLFGVELFELPDGSFSVNELAPRPHNTGHYTLDWGGPSQFEAHVRAVMGLPPVEPISEGFAVMANLLGQPGAGDYRKGLEVALSVQGGRFHWYGKAEAKPGRKMGHLNVVGKSGEEVADVVERAKLARERFYEAWIGE
ncbi:ATP-grasp domain-containing protein [bacterium]|nr:MAG: ATP-grasp domain-containing protein [bacterium]